MDDSLPSLQRTESPAKTESPATSAQRVTGAKLCLCNHLSCCLPKPPLPDFPRKQPPNLPTSQLRHQSHCRLAPVFSAHSEPPVETFSPDRHWSKFSANFFQTQRKRPVLSLEAHGFVRTARLLQRHPMRYPRHSRKSKKPAEGLPAPGAVLRWDETDLETAPSVSSLNASLSSC